MAGGLRHHPVERSVGSRQMEQNTVRLLRWGLPATVVVGLLLRLALVLRGPAVLEDPDNYLPLARSLAAGKGFALVAGGLGVPAEARPTAYRPPLYPIVLAPVVSVCGSRVGVGIAALHLVLAAGTILLTARAARRWGLSELQVLIASAIVALDPVLAAQTGVVMTEPLAAFLVAGTLAAVADGSTRGAGIGGIIAGLAALTRPSLLPFAGLAALAAATFPPGTPRQRFSRGAILALATSLTLVPWAWRNYRVFGEPIATTTHGGYTLALANNEFYYDDVLNGPAAAVWTGERQFAWFAKVNTEMDGLSEPEADRRLRASAVRVARERPRDFVRAAVARLARLWGIAPAGAVYPRWMRIASALWTIPLWVALVAGLVSRELWRWPRVAAIAAILALSSVHFAYWTDLRMRAPLVPAIALIAAAATCWRSASRWSRAKAV